MSFLSEMLSRIGGSVSRVWSSLAGREPSGRSYFSDVRSSLPHTWSFLSEFARRLDVTYTVIVMDEDYSDEPRRYRVHPRRVMLFWGGSMVLAGMLVVGAFAFTPLRGLLPAGDTPLATRNAQQNARRVAALTDSLRGQMRYMRRLQNLITGPVDSAFVAHAQSAEPPSAVRGELAEVASSPSVRRSDERGRASVASPVHLPAGVPGSISLGGQGAARPSRFPVLPPVKGFVTRGYDASSGHYAVDVAVEVGTPVRSIGDGYVIMADRSQQGGEVIAVQHGGGYVSVYKHNRRLLKRVGDHVRSREIIARSGNSGEITTGPHLHVELWQNGIAQDPSAYFIGW